MTYSKELHDKLRKRPAPWNEECIDLLDEIDRLNTENALLTAANKWVSVKVALPEDYQLVLFHDSLAVGNMMGMHISGIPQWSSNSGMFYHDGNYSWVTHWQPLPLPPTGGENE